MRSEGEQIYYQDKIIISDKSAEENYIGYSVKDYSIVSENNLGDGWKIECFTKYDSSQKHLLKGGDFVRLFHKEIEGFMVARENDLHIRSGRNSLARVLQFMYEEMQPLVGVRITSSFKEKNETNSVLSVWQIENQELNSGEPIEWEEPFRLKHLVYNSYLRVTYSQSFLDKNNLMYTQAGELVTKDGSPMSDLNFEVENGKGFIDFLNAKARGVVDEDNYTLSFTKNYQDPNTLFEGVSIAGQQVSDYVPVNGLIRIRHKETNAILKSEESSAFKLPSAQKNSSSYMYWFGEIQNPESLEEDKKDDSDKSSHTGSGTGSIAGSITSQGTYRSLGTLAEKELKEKDKFKKLQLSKQGADQHVFLVRHCSNITYDYFLYASSMVKEVKDFLQELKEKSQNGIIMGSSKEEKEKIKDIIEVLELLNGFLKGSISWSQHDENNTGTKNWKNKAVEENKKKKDKLATRPIKRRQKVLKELFLLETLLGIIEFFWNSSVFGKNINEESLNSANKYPWLLCKKCHFLVREVVTGNKSNVSVLIELGSVDMMLQQISTGWNPCVSEIFVAASGGSVGSQGLTKHDLKQIVDQIHEGLLQREYPHKIIDFLASICAPAGKGDYLIQKWVLELLVGGQIGPQVIPSSMIFHTKVDSNKENPEETRVLILLDNEGFIRPPYIGSKREKEIKKEDYKDEFYNEEMYKEIERKWIPLDEFLPDNLGIYKALGGEVSYEFSELPEKKNGHQVELRDKQVLYYRSILNLYRALCTSQNSKCQRIISGLVPVDHILAVLNSREISDSDKQLYLELFNELYANSSPLGLLPKSCLPSILIWKGSQDLLKGEAEKEVNQRIFSENCQPYITTMIGDWVTNWETEKEAEIEAISTIESVLETETLSIEEYIFKQRLGLYNYMINTFVGILKTCTKEGSNLATHVFKSNPQQHESKWRNEIGYWLSFIKFFKTLLLRNFFDDEYNMDIQGINEFRERKEKIPTCSEYEELLAPGDSGIQFWGLVAIDPLLESDDLACISNIITNILIQTSPRKHYKYIPNPTVDQYNKVFLNLEEGNIGHLLCDMKTELLKVLNIVYELRQTERVFCLWDEYFKKLYSRRFKNFDYMKLQIESSKQEIYKVDEKALQYMQQGFSSYMEKNVAKKFQVVPSESNSFAMKSYFKEMLRSFKELCRHDRSLINAVGKLFYENQEEKKKLSSTLLDMTLYQRSTLVVEATNMLHCHFSQRKEIQRIFNEATLLLDETYYKIYRLLLKHQSRLISLTQNFSKVPTKPEEMTEFYEIFKAGNPLLDPEVKTKPGLIDLCYTGYDLRDTEYSVFRRNKFLYKGKSASKKKKKNLAKIIGLGLGKNKQQIIRLKKKQKKEQLEEEIETHKLKDCVEAIHRLKVKPMVGKLDIWAKNQELIKTVGLHNKILKLIGRIFSPSSKMRPSKDPDQRYCQLEMLKVCYEFLFYFIWDNGENYVELTNEKVIEMLFNQMELDSSVVKLLTEIMVDNDEANNMVTETMIQNVVKKLNPKTWIIDSVQKPEKDEQPNFLSNIRSLASQSQPEIKNPPYPVRYISLLKTLVESDIGPKPSRQKQVIEVLMRIQSEDPDSFDHLLLKNVNGDYDFEFALKLFEEYKETVMKDSKNLTKVLDPREEEIEFNFHLEFLDLLGMCTKGANVITTNFCRSLYASPDSIVRPIASEQVPLSIRIVLTRFLHGVYFSDKNRKIYQEEKSQSIWHMYNYLDFKKMFVNYANDLLALKGLFDRKSAIEKREEEKEIMEEDQEEEEIELKKQMKLDKKNKMKLRQSKALESDLGNGLVANSAFQSIDNSTEVEELKVFLELEQYSDFVFDVLLPFLQELLEHDFEFMPLNVFGDQLVFENMPWETYQSSEIPDFSDTYDLKYLFRVLVFLSIRLSLEGEVLLKENWREGLKDFLKAIMNFINRHYDDENSILEEEEESAKQMQITIISLVNKLDSAEMKLEVEGSMELDKELVRERKKQILIKEMVMPEFMKSVNKMSMSNESYYIILTSELRKNLQDSGVQPEFAEYVSILLKKLEKHIYWKEGIAESQVKKDPRDIESRKQLEKRAMAEMEVEVTLQTKEKEDEEEEKIRQEDIPMEESNQEEKILSDSDSPRSEDEYFRKKNQTATPEDPYNFKPKRVSFRNPGSPFKNRSSQNLSVVAFNQVDKKDFMRWTGFGGKYLFRLVEILEDITVEGQAEADCFHLQALQCLVTELDQSISPHSLRKRQIALKELGMVSMLMSLISRAKEPEKLSKYLEKILPEVVKLGANLLALGIQEIQDNFINLYYEACKKLDLKHSFLMGIKALLKEARINIKFLNTPKGDIFITRILPNLLHFIKNLCEGHHIATQEFLNIQPESLINIDLITELSYLFQASCDKLCKNFSFVDNVYFEEKMSPVLFTDLTKKRKLIAWHRQNCRIPNVSDIRLCSQILRTLSETVQGPCVRNQLALTKARTCRSMHVIMEYIGTFFYRKTDNKGNLRWSGHGMEAYYQYLASDPPQEDIETIQITQFCQHMRSIANDPESDPTRKHILIKHQGLEYLSLVEALDNFEQNCLVFLNSLLEGSQASTATLSTGEKIRDTQLIEIPTYIQNSVDEDILIHNLHNYWKTARLDKLSTLKAEIKENDEAKWIYRLRRKVFLYYSFLTLLIDKDEQAKNVIKPKLLEWERKYNISIQNVVGRIEIQNPNQEIEVVYFPLPAMVSVFWAKQVVKEKREDLLYKVNRDNPEEKVMDFQDRSLDIITLIYILKQIYLMPFKYGVFGSLYKQVVEKARLWNFILVLLTIALNVLLVILYEEVVDGEIKYRYDWGDFVLVTLGRVHAFFSVVLFLSYTFMNGILNVEIKMERKNSNIVKIPNYVLKIWGTIVKLLTCYKCFSCLCRRRRNNFISSLVDTLSKSVTKVQLPNFVWVLWFYFSSSSTIYYLLFMLISFLGTFYDHSYFAFHLIILIRGVRLIGYVLSSVTRNIGQVIATLVLALIVLFWYTIIAFNVDEFRGQYSFEDRMACDSLLDCLRTHVDYGLTVNPFWNDGLVPASGIFFNFTYFIIINLIMTAIISGIIIDTFSEMRANSQTIENDIYERCFICNIDRDDFEKLGLDFNKHIKKEHNMWQYLFIRLYLFNTDPTEMTGQETYIYEAFKQNSIPFYPIKKAMVIEGRNKQKKDLPSLFLKLDKLDNKIEKTQEELEYEREKTEEESKKLNAQLEKIITRLDQISQQINLSK